MPEAYVELNVLAGQTAGFTGADLANLVNEAALLAARNTRTQIAQPVLEEGIMRLVAGPERRSRVLSEHERRVTAYHELGHAIVGHFLEHTDPVHKVSIVSRDRALGYTISLPSEDSVLTTKAQLTDTMAMTLGGRAAEEIVFGEITTGASNDLDTVTARAKQMVMRFGMSETLGLSEILLERETLEREQFELLLAGRNEDDVFHDGEVVAFRRPARSPAMRRTGP